MVSPRAPHHPSWNKDSRLLTGLLALMADWTVAMESVTEGGETRHFLCLRRHGANWRIYSGPSLSVLVQRALSEEKPDAGAELMIRAKRKRKKAK